MRKIGVVLPLLVQLIHHQGGISMLRRLALAATTLGGTVGGSLIAFAPSASVADGSGACVTLDINVNGQGSGGPQTVCTPAAPSAPGLPGLP
jgi:hypothetical protein